MKNGKSRKTQIIISLEQAVFTALKRDRGVSAHRRSGWVPTPGGGKYPHGGGEYPPWEWVFIPRAELKPLEVSTQPKGQGEYPFPGRWVPTAWEWVLTPPPPSIHGILQDIFNKQAVRILLECFLVWCFNLFLAMLLSTYGQNQTDISHQIEMKYLSTKWNYFLRCHFNLKHVKNLCAFDFSGWKLKFGDKKFGDKNHTSATLFSKCSQECLWN